MKEKLRNSGIDILGDNLGDTFSVNFIKQKKIWGIFLFITLKQDLKTTNSVCGSHKTPLWRRCKKGTSKDGSRYPSLTGEGQIEIIPEPYW